MACELNRQVVNAQIVCVHVMVSTIELAFGARCCSDVGVVRVFRNLGLGVASNLVDSPLPVTAAGSAQAPGARG